MLLLGELIRLRQGKTLNMIVMTLSEYIGIKIVTLFEKNKHTRWSEQAAKVNKIKHLSASIWLKAFQQA